jgi:hypothetical protein
MQGGAIQALPLLDDETASPAPALAPEGEFIPSHGILIYGRYGSFIFGQVNDSY